MLPPSSDSWPVIAFTSVLLPAPFGPMTSTISPRATRSEASLTNGTLPYPALARSTSRNAVVASADIGLLHLAISYHFLERARRDRAAERHHDDAVGELLHDL